MDIMRQAQQSQRYRLKDSKQQNLQLDESPHRFSRIQLLLGDVFNVLKNKSIIIFGVGGVGGFALDCLYRSGVSKIVIVDKDCFDVTNQNRQIGAERIGEAKVKVLEEMYVGIKGVHSAVDLALLDKLKPNTFDYVVDAIDDIDAKTLIATNCQTMRYGSFIISTGSAKKLDPLSIRVENIWNSYGDKFARKLRNNLRKDGISADFKCIFSPEHPQCQGLGSFSAVTASFGLQIASEIIQDIIKGERYGKHRD